MNKSIEREKFIGPKCMNNDVAVLEKQSIRFQMSGVVIIMWDDIRDALQPDSPHGSWLLAAGLWSTQEVSTAGHQDAIVFVMTGVTFERSTSFSIIEKVGASATIAGDAAVRVRVSKK